LLAGAVSATGLAAGAVGAPLIARFVDRYGQARVAVPATLVSVTAGLLLVLLVREEAPTWTLFAAYAGTSASPNTGGMARARWAHLYRDRSECLHVANSFEQVADEVCFMLGPVLAAFLGTAVFPEAGTLVTEVLLAHRGCCSSWHSAGPSHRSSPGSQGDRSVCPGLAGVVGTFLCTGMIFGSMEVTTVAFTETHGHASAAGVALALQAAGSCVAGLVYGLARPGGTPAGRLRRRGGGDGRTDGAADASRGRPEAWWPCRRRSSWRAMATAPTNGQRHGPGPGTGAGRAAQ